MTGYLHSQPTTGPSLQASIEPLKYTPCTHNDEVMLTTKVFKNGNSQAVRIPSEIAYDRMDVELEIERVGDEIRIRPVGRKLNGVMKKFAAFSSDFMASGREQEEQQDRESL